jgi:reverse gyrase
MINSSYSKRFSHTSGEIDEILNSFKADPSGKLIVLAGKNRSDKKNIVNKLQKSGAEIKEIDLRNIVSTVEEETYENVEELLQSLNGGEIVYLNNGDVLSGEYTGNTYSFRRYATPQEKYLLKKIEGSSSGFVLDLLDEANVNNLIERKSNAVIEFKAPKSGLSKLFWRLKQIGVHGHTFENKRPLKK